MSNCIGFFEYRPLSLTQNSRFEKNPTYFPSAVCPTPFLYGFCLCFVKIPCLGPIDLCYNSIFGVKKQILRISNLIFIWVLLMFCQNPLFGPYRFVSQKSYDNIPSKFLSTIETFFYLCFRGIWEVFQRPPKKSELESPERTK